MTTVASAPLMWHFSSHLTITLVKKKNTQNFQLNCADKVRGRHKIFTGLIQTTQTTDHFSRKTKRFPSKDDLFVHRGELVSPSLIPSKPMLFYQTRWSHWFKRGDGWVVVVFFKLKQRDENSDSFSRCNYSLSKTWLLLQWRGEHLFKASQALWQKKEKKTRDDSSEFNREAFSPSDLYKTSKSSIEMVNSQNNNNKDFTELQIW